MGEKFDILAMQPSELEHWLVSQLGQKPFRARQVFAWLHQRGLTQFSQMSDLSKTLREQLEAQADIVCLGLDKVERSTDGTIKYRFLTEDGKAIESVYMPFEKRQTLCVSSQVGCAMGCKFCLTAQMGFVRHLRPSEILSQIYTVNRLLKDEGVPGERPLSNLVFMGMGEPLHNLLGVSKALRLLLCKDGLNFSTRHVTVSTSGLPEALLRLAQAIPIKLAISLNASSDEQRNQLMPVNRKWGLQKLLEACRQLPLKPGQRLTFSYVMFRGINDSDEDALRLSRLIRNIPSKINLIAYNANDGLPFESPSPERIECFRALLEAQHCAVFVRGSRGRDISAACGQLAILPSEGEGGRKA
ncbi:MAG: 23S rRNA (adenine(2503)-C(2))-methyltransferase RlmN [Proteobacteria bacterium]|nr:23S rRNA (adenine(2503)-C(2))-methyltransferase RlmN [Cystobacterineae bacterium]MCL2314551.1 23S rRNA (adenine(2503)-C(2))-methyltransferase RlmN [Pseudomonadota bacterium]